MSSTRHTDRWLFVGIIAVMLAATGFIVWSTMRLQDRRYDLAEVALDRTQQMLRVRLDGLFHELAEDLREEASAVQERDSVHTNELLERWRPLLRAHWPVQSIRLADEQGNETALFRDGDGLRLMITSEGSKNGSAIMMRVPARAGGPGPDSVWISDVDNDPRKLVWFGKALEDVRDEPAWNLDFNAEDRRPMLQLSYLVRGRGPGSAYRVMALEVDLARSTWVDMRSSPLSRYGTLLLDGDGRILNIPDAHKDVSLIAAERAAARVWTADKMRWPFAVTYNDREFRAMVVPYTMNGQTLYTGTLIDIGSIALWTDPERIALWTMGVFVVLMSGLLVWVWFRKRKEDERVRRQVKRSRSQERKLAKALGEREVLNREVHHRVKNNLQVVSSLLNLQATRLDDGPVKHEFMRGKRRIDTIALVHHKLYGLQDLRNVDLKLFLTGLIEALAGMYQPASRTVSCAVNTGELRTDQDTAIELGIIVCELVANSYQHAFPYATGGHVDIQVKPVEGDLYRLVVKDNGKGLTEDYADGPGKLGLEIVEALAEQLDGSFHVRANGGVTFEVLFRMRREKVAENGEA